MKHGTDETEGKKMPNIKEKLVELMELNIDYGLADILADRLVANGVTIQQWISVEERLPECGEPVLVCDVRENYVGRSFFQSGGYWDFYGDLVPVDEFTHWMSQPELPKEGTP